MADENKVDAAEEEKTKLDAEEKQKELVGRIEQFNKELLPLLGKYELGLGATAFVTPQGTIGARPILFDARAQKDASETPEAEKDEKSGDIIATP